jgi:hypothetical protein
LNHIERENGCLEDIEVKLQALAKLANECSASYYGSPHHLRKSTWYPFSDD